MTDDSSQVQIAAEMDKLKKITPILDGAKT